METFTFEDIPYAEPSLFFPQNPNLVQDTLDCPDFQDLSNILDVEDPLSDPVIWSFCNETGMEGTSGPGPGHEFTGEGSDNGGFELFNFPDNSVPEDQSMQMRSCLCCQRLRVITHTNGMSVRRLEIHGRLGVIAHAIQESYSFDSSLNNQETQIMFDFQKESLEAVKKFLIQYFEVCKGEGYTMLQDPLSTSFYQALAVGLNCPNNPSDFLQFPLRKAGECLNNQQVMVRQMEVGGNQEDLAKIPLATQRERTRNLKLKDLVDYFNLPIEEAARKLNVCPTVMKKICRRNGMLRWPYRKIKSLERRIYNNVQMLDSSQGQERVQLLENIQRRQKELDNIYESLTE